MTQDKVMLLIDADNVSLDVIEQAVGWVGKHFGGPHVRRAYCTAESAVKHQAAFKRLSIRPMVNLAAGKNSTDIALAVDAIDLTLAERPEVVVIASSDSDFAPLVSRLREKGCRVIGIGQHGKTGDETRAVYDDYEVLEHRKAGPAGRGDARTGGRGNGRADGRGEGRGQSRAETGGDHRGEGRGESRRQGRGAGRGDRRTEARTEVQVEVQAEGRTGGRDLGHAQREALEPAQVLLDAPHITSDSQAALQAAVAEPVSEALPVPAASPAEARPGRARSRGGKRKTRVEDVAGAPVQVEAPPALQAALVEQAAVSLAAQPTPTTGPAPSEDLTAEPPGVPAKSARKPRRRRPAAAKRVADASPGSPP